MQSGESVDATSRQSFPKGPGDFLHLDIKATFGEGPTRSCGCTDRINQMNQWGCDGCRKHLTEITGWLVEQVKTHKWEFGTPAKVKLARFALKVPGGKQAVEWKCSQMVLHAIDQAEEAKVQWDVQRAEEEASQPAPAAATPVDVVYPLSNGSNWDDNELRYSLRSLEKYATNLGRVFVVGRKPHWLTGVEHIPMDDVNRRNKDANIINKVRAAIRAGVSKRFIRASDDQYFTAPVDLATLLITRGKVNASGKKGKHKRWWGRVQHTYDYLAAKGLPTVFYDVHLPQPCDAELFERAVADAPYEKRPGFTINTLVLNQHPGLASQPVGAVKGKLMQGYNDETLKNPDGLKRTLATMFPTPSRFELPIRPDLSRARQTPATPPNHRGIVTLAGGPIYSVNAYLNCRLLRDLGCTLPIEWCFLGEELSLAWMDLIRRTIHDVRLVDLGGGGHNNTKGKGGWQAKIESIIQSQFEELLFLDADSHPMRDPSYLFDHPLFQDHACVLWPDIRSFKPKLRKAIQEHHGVTVKGRQIESGQMLFRPAECRGMLEKTRLINQDSGKVYKYLHGDKDTFLIGGIQSGDSFALNPYNPVRGSCCGNKLLIQHDFDGKPLFTHLTGSKWKPNQVSTAKGEDYPHKERMMIMCKELERDDATINWRPIWKAQNMRVRDTKSAAEAIRIIQDDAYCIRPMIGHRIPVRYIIDIGGNAGGFTVAAATAYPGSEIICIEPDPELMDDIRWNTRKCQAKIHYVEAACVGNEGKEVVFIRTVNYRAGGHIERVMGYDESQDKSEYVRITVQAVRLPELLAEHGFESIDILKIDAEGVEGEVLADLQRTGWLDKTHWIRGEWHGREQWPIIREALARTHEVALEDSSLNGELIAHNRQDA